MYEELNKCKELLTKFGGHRLAAGLSLPKENVGKFREMLNKKCTLTEEEMKEKVTIDMEMPFGCVTEAIGERTGTSWNHLEKEIQNRYLQHAMSHYLVQEFLGRIEMY